MTIRKLAMLLFIINGLQFLLGIFILLGIKSGLFDQSELVLDLAVILILLSSLLSIGGLFSVYRYQNDSYRESMKNLEDFNCKLREQRHDYLNQLQIVFGLLELEEYEEARDYLRPVFKDIMKVNRALKTAQPAVNALLQAKMETAEKQGIDFYLEVGTKLSDLSLEPWELCKVLANLIDNAVTALSKAEGEKRISLEIREAGNFYQFAVRNNGPAIPSSQQRLIFSQGFTTKKEEGHGMGLFIVNSVLKEAGGDIMVQSDEKETSFLFEIPKGSQKRLSFQRRKMTR